MTAKVDAGGILAQQRVPISDDDTGRTLFPKLCSVGADLLLQTVREIENGSSTVLFPDESAASYLATPRKLMPTYGGTSLQTRSATLFGVFVHALAHGRRY